jgi:hypothetical protein
MPNIILKNTPPPKEKPKAGIAIMVDTPKAFRLTLDNAARGQKIIYYEGDLQFDRDFKMSQLKPDDRIMLRRVADCVYDASELDKVHLFQKRLGKNKWQYYALVRKR